ncbi:MAG: glycerophosphodiester phosphodiesterase family protein, partial [Egibacteraceae bacterium]
ALTPLATAVEVALAYGARVVCSQVGTRGLDGEGIAALHARGLEQFVWTVDDLQLAQRLASAGADALCGDDPGALRRHFEAGGDERRN